MAVNLKEPSDLLPVAGIRLGTTCAGIRQRQRDDLLLIEMQAGGNVAAVFTRNAFCAAPVIVSRHHLAAVTPRALLVNSGNANAGTGDGGIKSAQESCRAVADLLGCDSQQVLPFSTGVIGEPLPVEKIISALPQARDHLSADHWQQAARAIMTTDTLAKGVTRQVEIAGHVITVTGIAKGSGMIRPNMATMLAYIATDVAMEDHLLQQCLAEAVSLSFNRITVDGDTSTNDACVLMATGASQLPMIQSDNSAYQALTRAVSEVCQHLAQAIIRDGEGATKFITIDVEGGNDSRECLEVAYTIAHSPLVKTAFFASDPNWGRILAAVGRAGLENLDLEAIVISLDEVCIVRNGGRAEEYTEAAGKKVMGQEEITIHVQLGRGKARERVWTSDLSHEYVRINAEYRT